MGERLEVLFLSNLGNCTLYTFVTLQLNDQRQLAGFVRNIDHIGRAFSSGHFHLFESADVKRLFFHVSVPLNWKLYRRIASRLSIESTAKNAAKIAQLCHNRGKRSYPKLCM